ncbi:MAG: hypothetical protein ACRD1K_11900 [Acidimicrobiales bacterium]
MTKAKSTKDKAIETPVAQDAAESAPEPASPAFTDHSNGGNGTNGSNGRRGGLIQRMYGEPGAASASDLERQAAAEWDQAVKPVMELLHQSVPGAGSPEEAARILAERQAPYNPDPAGGEWVHGDAFTRDARVYYRLLRRDYEANPRPARTRGRTHRLHDAYGLLPGVKGW